MKIAHLPTPAALASRPALERNAAAMAERTATLGVTLRPHVKTHKCPEIARIQVVAGARGITVSTLREAHAFADEGFDDITYAVPIAPARVREALELARRLTRLGLLVDHPATVDAIEAQVATAGAGGAPPPALGVFLKVDCGYHRAGVDPAAATSIDLATRLGRSRAFTFRGLLTHAGHAYHARNPAELAAIAAAERDTVVDFAARLREAGVDVPEVSLGSTPTLAVARDLTGVTEARPGNYIFYDAFQAAIGSTTIEHIAFSVLTTVLSVYPGGRALIDAGALALSRDPGATHIDPDCGFGLVAELHDVAPRADLRVVGLSQEHGVLAGAGCARLAVGDRLRILPNHSCLAAALHEHLYLHDGGVVVDRLSPVRGW